MNARAAPDALEPRDHASQPVASHPAYRSSVLRSPRHALAAVDPALVGTRGPVFGEDAIGPADADLTANHAAPGESPIGERIVVAGRVLDTHARPVPHALIEIWQANAGGRYRHAADGYRAPLDPNFGGAGRTMTDAQGRYAFRTVRPGPYPWPNGGNDWRPAHIHLSVFGRAFAERLVTQLYFEGDPLVGHCPIVGAIADRAAVDRLVARLDLAASEPFDALAYRFDVVLRGARRTPFENRPEGA